MATVATMTDTAPLATTETATVALLLLAAVTESVTFRLLLVAGATTMCAGAMTVTVARLPVASATERCGPFVCPMLCMSVWRFFVSRASVAPIYFGTHRARRIKVHRILSGNGQHDSSLLSWVMSR